MKSKSVSEPLFGAQVELGAQCEREGVAEVAEDAAAIALQQHLPSASVAAAGTTLMLLGRTPVTDLRALVYESMNAVARQLVGRAVVAFHAKVRARHDIVLSTDASLETWLAGESWEIASG
jgi:hypothetical protein